MTDRTRQRSSEHQRETQPEEWTGKFAAIARTRKEPGVIVLTVDGQLLYRNAEGESMTRQLSDHVPGNGSPANLPADVIALCHDLRSMLEMPPDHQNWKHVEIRRIVDHSTIAILLRGFLLSDDRQTSDVRFLILMERLGRCPGRISPQIKERLHITNREEEIAQWIANGRTNKEIARILRISEHTVKEHIRHLLRKTKSHTRTGILARLYQDD